MNGATYYRRKNHGQSMGEGNECIRREFFAASAVQLEKMVLFTIRYIPDLDETMHIMFRGDKYNINFIDNIKYKNKYLEIKALLA